MSREIKFRAWNGKYMIDAQYGDWVSFDGVSYTEASYKHDTPNIEIERATDYILMQFTGLLDRNNTEVYQSDTITILDDEGKVYMRNWKNREIVFYQGSFGFWSEAPNKFIQLCQLDYECLFIEVTGNIYQNPIK